MTNIKIPLADCIIPMYDDVLEDILNHKHTHYVFPGGRGSTKSSFVGGIAIPLLIMAYPNTHAVCFRQVGNTIQKSIFSQVVWGIYKLGVESLFHIPKTYSTPIVYKPTGQQIIFMGHDDPDKVKSIKLPFGYIAITWFEELDQYSGENALRKTTQSTMRGGQLFWDFRTFNPPISRNNWANEYTEDCELYRTNDTLVVRNTYLDVPEDWLGPQFLEEANMLKIMNPRAYQHEYMGIAVGTGGDVFPNVAELNMSISQAVKDDNGNTLYYTVPSGAFDDIYNGLDWGFAIDPCAFNRMYFDRKHYDLYIFKELHTHRKRNKEIYDMLYNEQKLIKNSELLTCDSAEPKSIADFKSYGAFARGADKGPESVRYSIRWLQGLNHIFIDKMECPETWKEFTTYEYEQDKDGNFISAFPDENNHHIDSVRYAMNDYWKRKGA